MAVTTTALENVLSYLKDSGAPEDVAATVERLVAERRAANAASRARSAARSAANAAKYEAIARELVGRGLLPEVVINADVRKAVEEATECAASVACATRVIAALEAMGALVPAEPLKGYSGKCWKLAA